MMPTSQNVVRHFRSAATAYPTRRAIVHDNACISFGELAHDVDALALDYRRRGIVRGHRVLVLVPMSIDLYRVVLALLALGAVPVFLDQWASVKRMREATQVASCTAAVMTRKMRLLSWWTPEIRRIPIRIQTQSGWSSATRYSALSNEEEQALRLLELEVGAGEPALITFTTGSTGVPKAAVRSHAVLDAQLTALRPLLSPAQKLVDATLLPIVLLLNLAIGRTSLIPSIDFRRPAKFSAPHLAQQISEAGATSISGSPYYLTQLAIYYRSRAITSEMAHQAQPLLRVVAGGAPVFPEAA